MKSILNILLFFLISTSLAAQSYKDEISVVQFSAPFTKSAEISLKKFNDHNTYKFCISENKKYFVDEDIIYLPTIILYHNGEEVVRVASGISLKLPEDTIEKIEKAIEEIIENKF